MKRDQCFLNFNEAVWIPQFRFAIALHFFIDIINLNFINLSSLAGSCEDFQQATINVLSY